MTAGQLLMSTHHTAIDKLCETKMDIRFIEATRYVVPLREGGSLPAIIEGDDDGTYVIKFRGAGQGPKALIAELVSGEIARALGLPVPEIVFVELDALLGRSEPDYEIRNLIKASEGLNLALDYLPGSITFDPLVKKHVANLGNLASQVVWFDAFITNIDRTARNTNMLVWHKELYLIDHGASLYFHHTGSEYSSRSSDSFAAIKDHVLLPFAENIEAADETLASKLSPEILTQIIALIPESWLQDEQFATTEEHRAAYVNYFVERLQNRIWVKEARDAHQRL
jgi:hypothetical protein